MDSKIENTGLQLGNELKQLIVQSRQKVAISVNAEITLLYWHVGKRINDEILGNERAGYGKQIVRSLAQQLTEDYGRGWGEKQLRQCMQFATVFPDEQIVYALRIEFSWTHLRMLIYMDNPLKRDFYIEMCRMEKWSTRTLENRIDSMLFERTAISKKPEETIVNDIEALKNEAKLSPDLVLKILTF